MSGPLDHFKYASRFLSTGGVSLEEIAKEYGTPCYVYSAEGFLAPLRELQKGLAQIENQICFAVKSNSNLHILKLLIDAGAGMDLVSGGELIRALTAGVDPAKVVFSGVGKTAPEMDFALEQGIGSFNVESVAELELLNEVAVRAGKRAPVALRYNPDVNAKTHPYISTGLKKNKFGLEKREILALAAGLSWYPGVELKGLSIHIGSQLLSLQPLDDSFARVRQLADRLNEILPTPLEFVDLGGGVGVAYESRQKAPKISDYCRIVLKHFGPKSKLKEPLKIMIEPGRSIAANAGVLLTEVLYRKSRGKKDFLIVDAAMNDLLRPALYGSHHEIVPVEKKKMSGKRRSTDVVGPVCESSDCFASDRPLPIDLGAGDLVAILSAGAYGFTMSSTYNTRPRPPEVLVENGRARLIRRRETFDDLLAAERNV